MQIVITLVLMSKIHITQYLKICIMKQMIVTNFFFKKSPRILLNHILFMIKKKQICVVFKWATKSGTTQKFVCQEIHRADTSVAALELRPLNLLNASHQGMCWNSPPVVIRTTLTMFSGKTIMFHMKIGMIFKMFIF